MSHGLLASRRKLYRPLQFHVFLVVICTIDEEELNQSNLFRNA
jgi:hypothetical protein